MSESIIRKIQPFTIGTKLSAPGTKCALLADNYAPGRTVEECRADQRGVNEQVSLRLAQARWVRARGRDAVDRCGQEDMERQDHLNRNAASPTSTSRSIRKITICSSPETTRNRETRPQISPTSENINNNNNNNSSSSSIISPSGPELPRVVEVHCENRPGSHFKVLLHKGSEDEQCGTSEQTKEFQLNREKCSDVQQMPVFKLRSSRKDLIKENSSPCTHRGVSMLSRPKDFCFTEQNALFSKEISQAEAWIQEKLKNLRDSGNVHGCSLVDLEEASQTLQRDLKNFENTLIQLNQMGEQLICKLNPTSDALRKQLCQLREQWNTLKQTAASQTKAMVAAQSLQEFNRKVDQLEMWLKLKEKEQSLASPLGQTIDKLQLTRRILDLKQDEQLYRNLHEEMNNLAVKLEKQGKGEGKNISTRRKHINKMWLKVQSHLKDCQENLQLALEVCTFCQQADTIICSINNMLKLPELRTGANGDKEIRDIASQIMVLDVTVSQLFNLHPALATRVGPKQAELKESWLQLQSTVRNDKAVQLHSATREDGDLSTSNRESLKCVGMAPPRIMGKDVKEEQNRLKGIVGGRNSDNTRKSPNGQQEPQPSPAENLRCSCATDASARLQTQAKSGTPSKPNSHPQLHVQLQKFTVSADKTLSWLKDSVTMATHVCSSMGGPGSYEIAKRYQASLEQDILSNKARIELVKKEGYSLVRAQHPGSAKIQEFLNQLEVLWEELKSQHQKNAGVLQASEELSYKALRVLQALCSLEAWLEAVELSIKQASLAGDPESVSLAEQESCLLERELETHGLELRSLRQEVETLCSHRHFHSQLLPTRMAEVEKRFNSVQTALTQQSSELKDTRMLTEFLEKVELEESNYSTLGQPQKSEMDCEPSLLGSKHSEPVTETLRDPMEELREAVEMLNDTARERGRSQSHDQSIQELLSKHSIVAAQVEQCLQRSTELAIDVLETENEMAVRCEPEHCHLDSLQEQQDQLQIDYETLKKAVEAMENLFTYLAELCPERVHALTSEVAVSLHAWEELGKSIAENRSRLLQFGHLRHFFRKYLEVISWTEDTHSRIFSESSLCQDRDSQEAMVELLDQQIEQKFKEYDLLAEAGKKLIHEDHHLAKMIKERTEELRSMLGWILVHWRAQKDQWLNTKREEEPHNDSIYSEATVCSFDSQTELETSSERQTKGTEGSAKVTRGALGERLQLDNGYEVMQNISPKGSEAQHVMGRCDSPYLVLKDSNSHSLGGTVNLVLSFANSGESQLQEPEHENVVELSEAVHRVSTYLLVKDTIQTVAPVYESMTAPQLHGREHNSAFFSPCASLHSSSSSSSPEVDSTSLKRLPRSSASCIMSSLWRKSKRRKKKEGIHSNAVHRITEMEQSEAGFVAGLHEPVTYDMHTWPIKEKKRKNVRKSDSNKVQLVDYVKNPLVKENDAVCLGELSFPDPHTLSEQSATATTGHVKTHCRFLSLGSMLSFDLPKDMSHIPCIQDIIRIGPADSKKIDAQDQDSHPNHSKALSTFKLARSLPTHKHEEPKPAPSGEITFKIDSQENQRKHTDSISVSPGPLPAEDTLLDQTQISSLSLSHFQTYTSGISKVDEVANPDCDQMADHLGCSDHQPGKPLTLIKESPEQSEVSVPDHCHISSAAESDVCSSFHPLVQDLHGHQDHHYHKAKPTCSQTKRESPVAAQSHASHIVLNFKASGREDSVDSGHSSSGSFKLCTETPCTVDTSENLGPRRNLEKMLPLEVEQSQMDFEYLETKPTDSLVDDLVHPDHQQFEQEEEELEDIWNQTSGYRQSICSDIIYQGTQAEPKEQVMPVNKMITASAPNILKAEFKLPSIHNLASYRKDWNTRQEDHILSRGESKSWETFPQQEQAMCTNETASESVKLPVPKDQLNYIYQYKDEEEDEKLEETEHDKGHMKDQFMSVHKDPEGVVTESDAHLHNPKRTTSSPVSRMQEFPSMEGTLEKKHLLLLGGTKAQCRAWSQCHAILHRQTLCFYQDRKDTMGRSVTNLPLNLIGAECIPAPEYTKKPNCFRLRLCDGSKYLLSASSCFMMKKWMLRIQANTKPCESEANITTAFGHITQQHCGRPRERSPTLSTDAGQCVDSICDLLEHTSHTQSPRALPSSLFPIQDSSTRERRSYSFTSATYQQIEPTSSPAGTNQNSSSSYSVTLFIGDGENPPKHSSATLLQQNSRKQQFCELPLRGYASLPRPHNKLAFRKFFGKKE